LRISPLSDPDLRSLGICVNPRNLRIGMRALD
jgi:hypothetical protein